MNVYARKVVVYRIYRRYQPPSKRSCFFDGCRLILYRDNTLPIFHPEFGRFMLEATPGKPWGIGFKDLLDVEPDMRLRYAALKSDIAPLTNKQTQDCKGAYEPGRISNYSDYLSTLRLPRSFHISLLPNVGAKIKVPVRSG